MQTYEHASADHRYTNMIVVHKQFELLLLLLLFKSDRINYLLHVKSFQDDYVYVQMTTTVTEREACMDTRRNSYTPPCLNFKRPKFLYGNGVLSIRNYRCVRINLIPCNNMARKYSKHFQRYVLIKRNYCTTIAANYTRITNTIWVLVVKQSLFID